MHTLAIHLCDQANTWYILNFPRQILELAWSYNHWKLAQSYLERFVFWRNRKKELVHWCELFLFTYHYSPTWQDLRARHKSKTERLPQCPVNLPFIRPARPSKCPFFLPTYKAARLGYYTRSTLWWSCRNLPAQFHLHAPSRHSTDWPPNSASFSLGSALQVTWPILRPLSTHILEDMGVYRVPHWS